jgi:hypothetical protein
MDTLSTVVSLFAQATPDVVIDRFQAGDLNEFETYWPLGSATGDRSLDIPQVITRPLGLSSR